MYTNELQGFGVNTTKVFPKGIASFINVLQFDSLGNLIENQEKVNPKSLISLRIFVEKIVSEQSGQSIGSLLYANSFIQIDDQNSINLTEAVPNLLQWNTDASQSNVDTVGESKSEMRKDVEGLMPLKSDLESVVKRDVLLCGNFS